MRAVALFDHEPNERERLALRLKIGWRPAYTALQAKLGVGSAWQILGYASAYSPLRWLWVAAADVFAAWRRQRQNRVA